MDIKRQNKSWMKDPTSGRAETWPPWAQRHHPPQAAGEDQPTETLLPPYSPGPDLCMTHSQKHSMRKEHKVKVFRLGATTHYKRQETTKTIPGQTFDVIICCLIRGSHHPVCEVLHHFISRKSSKVSHPMTSQFALNLNHQQIDNFVCLVSVRYIFLKQSILLFSKDPFN